ncbi:HEPN domain-containing protein [Neisseriaceae bacterium B1]
MNNNDITDLEEIFYKNIRRVSSLIEIYDLVKSEGKERKKVTETDTLRASVVFLHAALEDVMRGLALIFWIAENNKNILEKIPLDLNHINVAHHNLKFTLGDLTELVGKNQTIETLIEASVRKYIYTKFTINDISQLKEEIKKLKFTETFQFIEDLNEEKKSNLINFFARRHRIVHHADRNQNNDRGERRAKAIRPETVEKWKEEIIEIVQSLFEEAKSKAAF